MADKEITQADIDAILEEFKERYFQDAWAIERSQHSSVSAWNYIKRKFHVGSAIVVELFRLHELLDSDQFFELMKLHLVGDGLDGGRDDTSLIITDLLSTNMDLQTEYYTEIEKLNKKFLHDNLRRFPAKDLFSVLGRTSDMGTGILEQIKLTPDSTLGEEYRNKHLTASWKDVDAVENNNINWLEQAKENLENNADTVLDLCLKYIEKKEFNRAYKTVTFLDKLIENGGETIKMSTLDFIFIYTSLAIYEYYGNPEIRTEDMECFLSTMDEGEDALRAISRLHIYFFRELLKIYETKDLKQFDLVVISLENGYDIPPSGKIMIEALREYIEAIQPK
tara:strand:- start:9782 stop:10792 length:1011 start_codon:yes stop_codon:yes gene_type:complete